MSDGGDAKKNQAACGRAGGHVPDMPKGSFQNPNPHVPGMESLEVRAEILRL
jgi:hypothetical protein